MRFHHWRPIAALVVASAAALAGAGGARGQPAPPGPRGPSAPLAPLGPRGTPDPRPLPLPHVVDDVGLPSLSARALERALAGEYLAGVRACWLASVRSPRASGVLRLELVIAHDGGVSRAAVTAPGVPRAERGRLEGCVRRLVRGWHFPIRRGATYAVIPLYFQRTRAPAAGTRPSCWSPRGCPPGKEARP
jgi:hypothetical protein